MKRQRVEEHTRREWKRESRLKKLICRFCRRVTSSAMPACKIEWERERERERERESVHACVCVCVQDLQSPVETEKEGERARRESESARKRSVANFFARMPSCRDSREECCRRAMNESPAGKKTRQKAKVLNNPTRCKREKNCNATKVSRRENERVEV